MGGGALVAALLVWVAFRDGGFFPDTWNLIGLVLLWLLAVVLLLAREVRLGRLDAALLAGLGLLTAWTFLSALWSIAPAQSVLEGQRDLLYLAAGAAVLVVMPRGRARTAPATVSAAAIAAATVICGQALISRLVAVDPLPYSRLGGAVGYWNALGMIAAAGACLALAAVAHSRTAGARAAAAATLPVQATTLYLSFSRGSWLALLAGIAIGAALDRRRRELIAAVLVGAIPCALTLACGAASAALTTPQAPLAPVTGQAHRLAVVLVLAAILSARLAGLTPGLADRLPRISLASVARPRVAALIAVAASAMAIAAAGGPARLSGGALGAFSGAPPSATADLNTHLFTLSGSWRSQLWHVAVMTFAQAPIAGHGAGTFERLWLMHRPAPVDIEDAHNLYLETLSELGLIGLVLLLGLLAVPLVAVRRQRRAGDPGPYAPALAGVYVAFAMHAGIDWDWEMPVVVLAQLACGAALVAGASGGDARAPARYTPPPLGPARRLAGLLAAAVLGLASVAFLVGNRDLAAAAAAADGSQASLAARAQAAARWAPWSPDPPHWLATVALEHGHRRAARSLLHTALARDRSNWTLWYELAAASDGTARRRALLRALRLDPVGGEVIQDAFRDGLIGPARHGMA